MRTWNPLLLIAALALTGGFALRGPAPASAGSPPAPHPETREAVPPKPLDVSRIDPLSTCIRIDKGDYALMLYAGDSLLRTYPVVLGRSPVEDKQMQGDAATPEGVFHIQSSYPHQSWTHFLWIDYPNDASREKFRRRKASGVISESAKIGGEIGIHGVPEGRDDLIDEGVNWTLGCIALKTAHITELSRVVRAGTEVEIVR